MPGIILRQVRNSRVPASLREGEGEVKFSPAMVRRYEVASGGIGEGGAILRSPVLQAFEKLR